MYKTKFKRYIAKNFIHRQNIKRENEWIILKKERNKKNYKQILEKFNDYISQIIINGNKYTLDEKDQWLGIIREVISIKKTNFKLDLYCDPNNIAISKNLKSISLSGFGYSGTSAIQDFLRDFEGCIDLFDGRELDIMKYEYSLNHLYKKLLLKNELITYKEIEDFFFIHVIGIVYPDKVSAFEMNEGLVSSKSLLKVILQLEERTERFNLIIEITKFVRNLFFISNLSNIKKQKELLELSSNMIFLSFKTYYKKVFPKSKYLLINNWVPSSEVHMYNLIGKNNIGIICSRNALDALTSWSEESKKGSRNILFSFIFLFLYSARHFICSKRLKNVKKDIRRNINFVDFESFVNGVINNQRPLNKNIIFLNEEINLKKVKNIYEPHQSKKNIGLFNKRSNIYYKKSLKVISFLLRNILRLLSIKSYPKLIN